MDRPPPGGGTGGDRCPTGPGRPGPDEPPPAPHGYDDPDPGSRRPDLYRPLHTDPDSVEAVPADSMPTEPIAVTTDPLPITPSQEQPGTGPRYEGDWADWMSPEDDTERPAAAAGPPPPEPVPESTDTTPTASSETADTPTSATPPATAGVTAQQRLRDRLAPPDDAAPIPDRPATRPARTRLLPVVAGVVGAAALAAAAYVQFAVVGGAGSAAPATEPTATPRATAPPSAVADPDCPAGRSGSTVRGNGPGGTDSGAAAIFGFQHAYYVDRSGAAAREFVTSDATVPGAADIQHGIDSVPAETTHCIQISPGAFVGQYHVVITEYRAGTAPLVYNPQFVTTRPIGDRTLIHGIGPMP